MDDGTFDRAMETARTYAHGRPSDSVERYDDNSFSVLLPRDTIPDHLDSELNALGFTEVEALFRQETPQGPYRFVFSNE